MLKVQLGMGRSAEVKTVLQRGTTSNTQREGCECRELRVLSLIGEAPDSIRGLTWGPESTKSEWKRIWRVVEGMDRHGKDR